MNKRYYPAKYVFPGFILMGFFLGPIPAVHSARPTTTTATAPAPRPFSLRECIIYALENSPELQRKDITEKNQKLNTTIERAEFDPVLGGGSSYTNPRPSTTQPGESVRWDHTADLNQKIPGGIDLNASTDYFDTTEDKNMQGSYCIRLSKQILGGGTLTESLSKINTSLLNELITANDFHKEKRRIVFQVKQQFFQTVRALQTLTVQEHILERSRQNLKYAIEREDPLDTENARAEIPSKETEVIRAKTVIKSALDQLKVFIGLNVGDPFAIDPEFEYIAAVIHPEKDIHRALKNHEDILNSGLRTQILEIDEKVTRTRSWPEVFLYAEQRDGLRNADDYLVSPGQTIGVLLKYPIGERANRAKHEQARNRLIDEGLQLYQISQDLTRNIRDQARGLNELRESILLHEQYLKVRERILQLYKDRYDSGEINILEYLRSQNDLERARVDLIALKTNYMGLLAEYDFSTVKN